MSRKPVVNLLEALAICLVIGLIVLSSCGGGGNTRDAELAPSQDIQADGWFLLPDGSPSTCMCHEDPPDNTAATWADAPGLHASCLSCHQEHGFVIEEPSGICEDCHTGVQAAVTAAGMPDCSSCHAAVHIPSMPVPADCQACHPTPPENNEASWDDPPGLHSACLSCHEQHTFAISPPESVCANCHGELIEAGHASGFPQCLECHQNAHLPEIDLDESTCVLCHANPRDVVGEWAAAPGAHAACLSCHPGPEHGTKPVPPSSVCADCHGDLITAGHAGGATACLQCHVSPHLPSYEITQADCQICHTTPPEDAGAIWANAPGAHDDCAQCHPGPEHGDVPDPPDSVCGNCHAEIAQFVADNSGVSCLACHAQPHLPVLPTAESPHPPMTKPASADGCLSCHLAPPDRPSDAWDDAPFAHQLCLQCHSDPEHGDRPDPPNSVCGNCHQGLIDSGHQGGNTNCLLCHQSPHVPQVP